MRDSTDILNDIEEGKFNGVEEEVNEAEKERKAVNKVKMMESMLTEYYDFRFNVILNIPEYKVLKAKEWKRMDDFTLNSVVRDMKLAGVSWASRAKIGETVESNFCEKVNPIEDYFNDLPDPGKVDHIKKLSDTLVVTDATNLYRRMFKKWLVGCVANVFIKHECANHLCFILIGNQGTGKSTWLRKICPVEFRSHYYYEGALDPDNKDHLFNCAANFIYNLDDYFSAVTSKKVNELKDFITKPKVKARRPYARYVEEMPKICSFCGTANEETILYDYTGSRRFLPFKADSIDYEAKIDIDLVWAQAVQLFKSDFQYWLSPEEQEEMEKHNAKFRIQTLEYELVATYFARPISKEDARFYLTSTQILNDLELKTKRQISPKKVGEALRELEFERFQKRFDNGIRRWVYAVDKVDIEKAEKQKQSDYHVTEKELKEVDEIFGKSQD